MRANSKISAPPQPAPTPGNWTFLTNHTHVLLCLAGNPQMRVRDVADAVGITERAVQKIIRELEAAEVLVRERLGRRNTYQINRERPLRHPVEAHCRVGQLIDFVVEPRKGDATAPRRLGAPGPRR